IDLTLEPAAKPPRNDLRRLNFGAGLIDVAVKHPTGKHARRKIAEAALGATERHRDVNSQRHLDEKLPVQRIVTLGVSSIIT
ncbi:MAG TPA: hypothetical protein VKB76_17685, partial [Ktedonobacterales bacterium]|nr:hypothetical protein [Ktedonobacterales bacterium]